MPHKEANKDWPIVRMPFLNQKDGSIIIDAAYIYSVELYPVPQDPSFLILYIKLQDKRSQQSAFPLCCLNKAENIEALEQWQGYLDAGKSSNVFPEITPPKNGRRMINPT